MSKIIKKALTRAAYRKESNSIPVANLSGPEHSLPRERVGLFNLSEDNDGKSIDVVAVHGLQGDPYKTWEHDNGSIWLRDFLPADIPLARIMTFGYESTVAFSKSVAKLEDKSLELLNRLSAERGEAGMSIGGRRPIVFICHNLGGVLVKKALILAHERSSDLYYKDIVDNTRAIIFLGVPHNGIDSAWWANFVGKALRGASIGTSTNTALVADLRRGSNTLINISKQFVDRGKDLKIYTFYETQRLAGIVVVDELSARIGMPNEKLFPVDANHRSICKIPAKESQMYKVVGVWTAKLVNTIIRETLPKQLPLPNTRIDYLQTDSPLTECRFLGSVSPTRSQGITGPAKSSNLTCEEQGLIPENVF